MKTEFRFNTQKSWIWVKWNNFHLHITPYFLCWWNPPRGYLLSTFNRQLRKDIFLQPTDHDSCFHQIMQLLMIASTLKHPKKALKKHIVISHRFTIGNRNWSKLISLVLTPLQYLLPYSLTFLYTVGYNACSWIRSRSSCHSTLSIEYVRINTETAFTWGNSSIGRDKAGVPLSKTAYLAFCDCKSQLVVMKCSALQSRSRNSTKQNSVFNCT
jgi:hypothetical protein